MNCMLLNKTASFFYCLANVTRLVLMYVNKCINVKQHKQKKTKQTLHLGDCDTVFVMYIKRELANSLFWPPSLAGPPLMLRWLPPAPMFINRLPREHEFHQGDDLEIGWRIEEVKTRDYVKVKTRCKLCISLSRPGIRNVYICDWFRF